MKLLTYSINGVDKVGVIGFDDSVLDISLAGIYKKDMNDLIVTSTKDELSKLRELSQKSGGLNLKNITKRAVIPHPLQDVICLGINFMEHAVESYNFKKIKFDGKREYPVYFSKRVNEAVADGGTILSHSDITKSLDYEAELALIISKDAKNVSKDKALEYVFGWSIINDISSRDIQNKHKQWYYGKSLDRSLPFGPWIVTSDELDVSSLDIKSFVNGELRQNSNTSKLIFDAAYVISDLSKGMTLKAGTIISLGTPSGVGMGFTPPKFLNSGDEIVCFIEGIGELKNIIL
ncbi:fumarylacetoacetate hydrolase family protein [Campylobacter hyointestinalis]|uniref:Fumarylacetoacetase n=1 Tax=Campylobacter hyointestinalis subsp. hyointestinalis TaxID=91352 RepID=A0A855ND10_CAMHY|nr:fumarylacetoacetate hydrolase family protein [Campylobacter hyointestinalis]ANE32458.1 fumarylacetoacetate (FAA) hydrolase family protein [Campylobacter hyointestinalis subsp. hyointestinalis LMG 9260]MBT0612616.1 fumarylacetoacetate hydrolase family protein [Campylobacter hyointestinalis subsp. hyointestinalis]MDY2999138.1 fumarylacetoacetate hydrolase family protein [Campylobacter hyointestinalis]PPB56458.1 fumarylacetoacetase [Campylobacter hyointestinalis subsp. hyointestinalis]PPB59144